MKDLCVFVPMTKNLVIYDNILHHYIYLQVNYYLSNGYIPLKIKMAIMDEYVMNAKSFDECYDVTSHDMLRYLTIEDVQDMEWAEDLDEVTWGR